MALAQRGKQPGRGFLEDRQRPRRHAGRRRPGAAGEAKQRRLAARTGSTRAADSATGEGDADRAPDGGGDAESCVRV
jgi:hypothetical protein